VLYRARPRNFSRGVGLALLDEHAETNLLAQDQGATNVFAYFLGGTPTLALRIRAIKVFGADGAHLRIREAVEVAQFGDQPVECAELLRQCQT
jgi:hypothetical protein